MDALTKFLCEKDPLGTAGVLQVTKAELEALLDEVHVASFGDGYDEGFEDGSAGF